jgi:SAM-dependent methyltransferase
MHSIELLVETFDELDQTERLRYTDADDRAWLLVRNKGTAEAHYEQFNGAQDVTWWMRTTLNQDRGGYLPDHIRAPLIEQSHRFDQEVLLALGEHIDEAEYKKYIGPWNADDFFMANAYPVPGRQQPRRVLDFGAGYGRQVNLWHQNVSDLQYVAVDVIRKSYLCQCCYFQHVPLKYHEYLVDREAFIIDDSPGIFHVPAWRWDRVPSNHFDMILAIMVLPEIYPETLFRTLHQFERILKPGGALFIRDHGLVIQSANTEDVAEKLRGLGFVLEFRPYVKDKVDLRGIPRIWRKRVPGTPVADEPES